MTMFKFTTGGWLVAYFIVWCGIGIGIGIGFGIVYAILELMT